MKKVYSIFLILVVFISYGLLSNPTKSEASWRVSIGLNFGRGYTPYYGGYNNVYPGSGFNNGSPYYSGNYYMNSPYYGGYNPGYYSYSSSSYYSSYNSYGYGNNYYNPGYGGYGGYYGSYGCMSNVYPSC
ncbi:MAG: hypothetical protein KGI58_01450 [Patescibacteria group bacterium]|nr:hypothetical protein [Patescibacteria group bacterium]